MHRDALRVLSVQLGNDHLESAATQAAIGQLLHRQHRHQEALKHLQPASRVTEQQLGRWHPRARSLRELLNIVQQELRTHSNIAPQRDFQQEVRSLRRETELAAEYSSPNEGPRLDPLPSEAGSHMQALVRSPHWCDPALYAVAPQQGPTLASQPFGVADLLSFSTSHRPASQPSGGIITDLAGRRSAAGYSSSMPASLVPRRAATATSASRDIGLESPQSWHLPHELVPRAVHGPSLRWIEMTALDGKLVPIPSCLSPSLHMAALRNREGPDSSENRQATAGAIAAPARIRQPVVWPSHKDLIKTLPPGLRKPIIAPIKRKKGKKAAGRKTNNPEKLQS